MISKHFKTSNFLNKFVWVTWSALQSSDFNSRWTMLGIHTHRQGIEKKVSKMRADDFDSNEHLYDQVVHYSFDY